MNQEGTYYFSFQVYIKYVATEAHLELRKNNVVVCNAHVAGIASHTEPWFGVGCSAVINCSVGDVVHVYAASSIDAGGDNSETFTGFKISN